MMAAGRIRGFDGLRAVAIVLVVLWHTKAVFGFRSLGVLDPLVNVGWAGVDLFFGLSGFLITSLILGEERETGRFGIRDFYARRVLRIFPPYWTVLAVTGLVLSRFEMFRSAHWPWETAQPLYVASLLFLFSNYLDLGTIGFAYIVNWSLCVEEHFYLFWPATLLVVRSRRARVIVGLAVCALVPLLRFDAIGLVELHRVHSLSHLRIDSILWGALAALLFDWLREHARIRRVVMWTSGAAALFFVGEQMTFRGYFLGLTILAIAVAAFVSNIAATPESPLVTLLELAPLRAIGKVSYGMYLLHFQALDVIRALAPPGLPHALAFVLFSLCAVALTWAAAAVLYRVVERPALRLKRHFAGPAPAMLRDR
jgi:peptidoglycan/LPS O-acetylase OafA/YrhL